MEITSPLFSCQSAVTQKSFPFSRRKKVEAGYFAMYLAVHLTMPHLFGEQDPQTKRYQILNNLVLDLQFDLDTCNKFCNLSRLRLRKEFAKQFCFAV